MGTGSLSMRQVSGESSVLLVGRKHTACALGSQCNWQRGAEAACACHLAALLWPALSHSHGMP